MRIAVMGAGGIGGFYGALLSRAGHEVILIARGAHLEAIRRDGLTLIGDQATFPALPAPATGHPAAAGRGGPAGRVRLSPQAHRPAAPHSPPATPPDPPASLSQCPQ